MSKRTREAEDQKRKNSLKKLFKKTVRVFVLNHHWLEDTDDQKMSSNAKKNIALLIRTKRKPGLLTTAEKALFRTPQTGRSIADRKKLCTLVARLKCFSRVPPKARARLVPYIHFMAVSPGRKIIKEGDMPIAVFFILTGEVVMRRYILNNLANKMESKVEAIFGPGDCIGDVELLENCLRTHTFIATSQCEIFVLYQNEFISILRPSMKKLWNAKKKALKALDYFDFLNEEQVVNACRFATLKQFNPLETIYYEDRGSLTNVHFVLSGECVILQCLRMKITYKKGHKKFELSDISDKTDSMFKIVSVSNHPKSANSEWSQSLEISDLISSSNSEDESKSKKKVIRNMGLKDMERACGLLQDAYIRSRSLASERRTTVMKKMRKTIIKDLEEEDELEYMEEYFEEMEDNLDDGESETCSYNPTFTAKISVEKIKSSSSESEVFTTTPSICSSTADADDTEKETHFIDVGSLTFGGIFGLGEKIEHRVIMARTTVQCLMLPRFWLMEKEQNPGNIWQRRIFYLDCTIPSRESLFEEFLRTRKWEKFKYEYVHSTLVPSANDIIRTDDIPIICRIVETTNEESNIKGVPS